METETKALLLEYNQLLTKRRIEFLSELQSKRLEEVKHQIQESFNRNEDSGNSAAGVQKINNSLEELEQRVDARIKQRMS